MATTKFSLLTFPQRFKDRKITFNILLIPKNFNPLLPFELLQPSFAEAILNFSAKIINKFERLPVITDVTDTLSISIQNPSENTTEIWESLRKQIKASDGLIIDETETNDPNQKSTAVIMNKYAKLAIRKHLPETYTSAFNFTKARTKFATTGDEYDCAVKNFKEPTDKSTKRDTISWGKVVALILRNPILAEKAGLVYKATINLPEGMFDDGGWLFTAFANDSDYISLADTHISKYAARIPALKKLQERILFSPVQFPILATAATNAAYDEIFREAIIYDDGFAKIVHANQPVNHYLLKEKDATNSPIKDIGIRLGWDDEQMLIWQNRQMRKKEENTDLDVEAPLGVFGYRIDVRKNGTAKWLSQNTVIAKDGITLQEDNMVVGDADSTNPLEPAVEIHPTAHGNSETDGFWLPVYFTNWMGKALSIPDKETEEINNLTNHQVTLSRPSNIANTINTIPKKTFHPYLQNPSDKILLTYGNKYDFRVRMMDITGGGPTAADDFIHSGQRPVDTILFKRLIGAGPLEIINFQNIINDPEIISKLKPMPDISVLQNITETLNPSLIIRRPLLQYPSVVFTGKYDDPVSKLKNILNTLPVNPEKKQIELGLPDPDVNEFLVQVEVQTLAMDNAKSATGKEAYIKLYEKKYAFDPIDFEVPFNLKITYMDINNLDLDGGFTDPNNIIDELILPNARHIRLSFIPLVSNADDQYAAKNIAHGKPVILSSFRDADQESLLLIPNEEGLKAIYLQPETDGHHIAKIVKNEKQQMQSSTPIEMKRLADSLFLAVNNLTLEGKKGQRVQFGCSKLLRHSLAPDSSSITLSSLQELFNQWIIGVDYSMNRDWTWDGLEVESIHIMRSWKNFNDNNFKTEELAGIIQVSRTASINALIGADRNSTRLLFLDAFDPKKSNDKFPEELLLKYRIFPKFRKIFAGINSGIFPMPLHLPVTISPHQVPKLISAGIALSSYKPDEDYASTQVRQKFLWLEMEAPPHNPNDAYFIRVLANAPDPILCNVNEAFAFNVPEEPLLNINDEKIRVIITGMENDFAGLDAMQEVIPDDKAASRYYMVPLPNNLHASSDELFGFFTYEICVGHSKKLWSTAKARYGRPLKVNGVQHPAPALVCNVFRRKYKNTFGKLLNEIVITAPFANAVLNGKNVAANPPQTSLWYLLYAQIKQADGITNRNILLHSKQMKFQVKKAGNGTMDEGTRYGVVHLQQEEVSEQLKLIGLPVDTRISVLCIEMFPHKNIWRVPDEIHKTVQENPNPDIAVNPLIEGLGKYRIYRSSALVAVGNICCDDC